MKTLKTTATSLRQLIMKSTYLFIIVLFLSYFVPDVFAQERAPDRGFQFGSSYAANGFDSVNVSNGNVVVNLPVASLPAGIGPGFTVTLQYNSKLWDSRQEIHTDAIQPGGPTEPQPLPPTYRYSTNTLQLSDRGGWKLLTGYRIIETNRLNLETPNPCLLGDPIEKRAAIWKMEVEFPDGTVRQFVPTYDTTVRHTGYFDTNSNGRRYAASTQSHPGNGLCYVLESDSQITTGGMHFITTDGSRLRLFIPYHATKHAQEKNWKLYSPDGMMVENLPPDDGTVGQRITDRNGNKVETKGNQIIDQWGRSITIGSGGITVKGVDGEDITTQIVYGSHWVNRPYKITGHDIDEIIPSGTERAAAVNTPILTVDEVVLPAQLGGQSYTFDYYAATTQQFGTNYTEGWGELKSMTLPSGAVSTYDYETSAVTPEYTYAADVLENNAIRRTLSFIDSNDGMSMPKSEVTTYATSPYGGYIVNPDGSGVSESKFYFPITLEWRSGLTYRQGQTGGVTVENIWVQNTPNYTNSPYTSYYLVPGNANASVKTEFTSIRDGSGELVLTAIKDYKYDKNGNVTKITEYDWIAYSSVPREYTRPTGIPSGAVIKRVTENDYYNPTPDSESESVNGNTYENPSAPKLKNVIKSTQIKDGGGNIKARSEFLYDDPNNIGNLIATRVWDSTKGGLASPDGNGFRLNSGNSVSSFVDYDTYGNVIKTTDAKGVETRITYGNITTPTGTVDGLYPTQTVTAYGTSLARTSTATYDFFTGLVLTATDVDNNITNATVYDDVGRPVKSISALGTPLESWTTTEYNDELRRVIVRSDLEAKGDGKKVAIQHFDQLGRVRLARTLENSANESPYNETHGIKAQTRYLTTYSSPDGFTYQLTSNPYRADYSYNETDATMGWTRSKSWNNGKKQEIETFSGSALPAPWGSNTNSTGVVTTDIDANTTTVTDQAGKKRRTVNNALGHLIRVDEPNDAGELGTISTPNQPTSYTYDTLNNLLTVVQGSQTRTFVYSSLSRMLSETSPEAGTTLYEFDNNGNPTKKTDSRGVSTNFTYDILNRVTQKSYTGESGYTTPTITYTYDEHDNAIGRLTKVSSSISETRHTEFDRVGRILKSKQITDGQNYDFDYTYDLSGALIKQTYPSGRVIKSVLDPNGDLTILQSKKSANYGFWNYAQNFTYNAAGAITSLQLGNGRWQSSTFNSRMQMTQTGLGITQGATNLFKLEFGYGTTQNNGNLVSQVITVPAVGVENGYTATQSYTYDSLSRLKTATEVINSNETWKQTFMFDRYGNRNFDEENTSTLTKSCMDGSNPVMCAADRKVFNPSVNQSNNRLNASEDYAYDATGNTISDPQGRIFKYDGENKQYEVRNSSNDIIGQYFFDGNGKRIKKIVPSIDEITVFVYDAMGKLSAEYSTKLSQDPKVSYTTADALGSPRIKTDENGEIISRNDYHPFGEDIYTTERTQTLGYKSDDIRQKFTTYLRDEELDLDFAEARIFSKNLGRFSSVDPFNPILEFQPEDDEDEQSVDEARQKFNEYISQSQHWNRYSYGLNNPYLFVDPDGKAPVVVPVVLVIIRFAPAIVAGARYLASPQGQRAINIAQRQGVNLTNFTLTRGGAISNNVFALNPLLRGQVIEGLMGVSDKFAKGFPVIDSFVRRGGIATSIKSLDIFAKSYSNMTTLTSTLNRYVDQLARFESGARNGIRIVNGQVTRRILQVVLPNRKLSVRQQSVLLKIQQEAARKGVELVYVQTH